MTGPYPDSQDFTMRAVRQFQPVFDELLEVSSKDFYAGRWTAGHQQDGGPSEAIVKVERGTIFVERLILNGTDTLNLLQGSPPKTKPASLWNTGRNDEFK